MTVSSQIVDNRDQRRFELTVDGLLATLIYRRPRHTLVLVHTEVPPELEGRGLGGRLVAAAVESANADGLSIEPLCPFARSWLERHPEVAATVGTARDQA
jgi:predicted GNAT family acetyltransferase